jgi:hypothetical protein
MEGTAPFTSLKVIKGDCSHGSPAKLIQSLMKWSRCLEHFHFENLNLYVHLCVDPHFLQKILYPYHMSLKTIKVDGNVRYGMPGQVFELQDFTNLETVSLPFGLFNRKGDPYSLATPPVDMTNPITLPASLQRVECSSRWYWDLSISESRDPHFVNNWKLCSDIANTMLEFSRIAATESNVKDIHVAYEPWLWLTDKGLDVSQIEKSIHEYRDGPIPTYKYPWHFLEEIVAPIRQMGLSFTYTPPVLTEAEYQRVFEFLSS